MTEQAKVPAIRFAGFTDPWEQRKLGDIASFSKGSGYSKADIRESGIPLFLYGRMYTQYETRVDSVDTFAAPRPGTLYSKGTEIVVPASGESAEDIARASAITREGIALGGDLNVVYPQRMVTPLFLAYGLSHGSSQKLLAQKAQGKTVVHIHASDLKGLGIAFPDVTEQQAIGTFFSSLDDLITLHQRKYDKLVVFKKSMLEKMFPKDGESVPEIRFAGFTDPWEQRKLGDVASSFDYGLNAAATEYDGQNKYLRITDIDDETHEFSKSDLTTPLADLAMSADYLLKEGDLLFARTGASVGKTYLYRQFDGMVYFAGFLIRARIGEGADPEFAYQATLTDAYKKYVAITSQRSGQPGVNAQEYADYQLMLPSKTEQQQIGMTLRSLDDLITLHQRKLELLQNIKKSLLDKMFA